jgi:DNA-directed RNA polymerase subunit beta
MAKRASVIKDSKLQDADDREVDVELISPTRLTGTHAQVVPMYSNAQSPRLFYAARFVNQAMPIVEREAPLVQSLDPESKDGKSFEQHYGKYLGASYWDDKDVGEVVNVTPDAISIRKKDGSVVKRDMYNNFQFNRKTYITNKPRVQKGDIVQPGQILAASNFTDDDGTMSFGRNARIAVVPYKGYSMDDAIVVSESFANKMRSMHNYAHELQKDEHTKFGKTHYTSVFPQKFTKEQLESLDENGIVKPGTVLKKGDPIMLATRPKAARLSGVHLSRERIFTSLLRLSKARHFPTDLSLLKTEKTHLLT